MFLMKVAKPKLCSAAILFTGHILLSGCAHSEADTTVLTSSSVPVSVSGVKLKRVNKSLVRVIQHNMEIDPKLEVERLKSPDLHVSDYLVMTSLNLNGETLQFSDSQGVFIEDLAITKTAVEVTFDFYFAHGGSALINCAIDLQSDKLTALPCQR